MAAAFINFTVSCTSYIYIIILINLVNNNSIINIVNTIRRRSGFDVILYELQIRFLLQSVRLNISLIYYKSEVTQNSKT
jgi:hypothetical protein